MDIHEELAALKKELRAITTREEWYWKQGRWDEMIPWFDLQPIEKRNAIEYWSEP